MEYTTEEELYKILIEIEPNVRILGSDWEGKKYTGYDLDIPIYFHNRDHEYSTSNLRKRVYEAEFNKKL